jgi:predicted DNA-binding ribbon-helix-helix protein
MKSNRKSTIVKYAVVINGRKTNVSLEQNFWSALRDIASWHSLDLQRLVSAIDASRDNGNLSSQLRLFVTGLFQEPPADQSSR